MLGKGRWDIGRDSKALVHDGRLRTPNNSCLVLQSYSPKDCIPVSFYSPTVLKTVTYKGLQSAMTDCLKILY